MNYGPEDRGESHCPLGSMGVAILLTSIGNEIRTLRLEVLGLRIRPVPPCRHRNRSRRERFRARRRKSGLLLALVNSQFSKFPQ